MAGSRRTKKKKDICQITLENFGPISNADVIFNPLTVIIGPNNSGKSYLSTVLYSFFDTIQVKPPVLREKMQRTLDEYLTEMKDFMVRLSEIAEKLRKTDVPIEVPEDIVKNIITSQIRQIFQDDFKNILSNNFNCPINDLTKCGLDKSNIGIILSQFQVNLTGSNSNFSVSDIKTLEPKIFLRSVDEPREYQGTMFHIEGDKVTLEFTKNIETDKKNMKREDQFKLITPVSIIDLIKILHRRFLAIFPSERCYYLPAARSGLMQEYIMFLTGIIHQDKEKPSDMINTFFKILMNQPEQKGPFFSIAEQLENEMIEGKIDISILNGNKMPTITYYHSGMDIPLKRSSSSVSELTPLIIYLKHILNKGDLLIYEEPESHLHPNNQRLIAKYLIRLIRAGLKIVIITHSDFLLEQINSFIRLTGISAKDRKEKYKYALTDFIRPDEITGYVFKKDADGKGFHTEKISISPLEGISEQEFSNVNRDLYNESINLQRDLKK